ncbi:DUF1330 domain-containing protein [Methylophilus luteus]|uniref:DUF1330 domain-containing protein n=1 Tax=Methylophilus luteus TaxID=640108 RepID=A0ABW3F2E4_9PROT
MSAYVVMMREKTTDQAEMDIYASQAPLAREGHSVTPLARYGALDILEGQSFEGCLIHRFPSMAEAQAWYHSPKYQQAVQHRHQGAQYRVFIVEGLDA